MSCNKPDGHYPRDGNGSNGNACKDGFHKTWLGLWCSADCPEGMSDINIACIKDSKWRGLGTTLGCSGGKQKSGLFCFNQCENGYEGTSFMCFSVCAKGTTTCGPAMCIKDGESCLGKILSIGKNIVVTALRVANAVSTFNNVDTATNATG